MVRMRVGNFVPQHSGWSRASDDSLGSLNRSGYSHALHLCFGRNFHAQDLPTDPFQIRYPETNERSLQQEGQQDVSFIKVNRWHWGVPLRILLLVLCSRLYPFRFVLDHCCSTNDAKPQGLLLPYASLVILFLYLGLPRWVWPLDSSTCSLTLFWLWFWETLLSIESEDSSMTLDWEKGSRKLNNDVITWMIYFLTLYFKSNLFLILWGKNFNFFFYWESSYLFFSICFILYCLKNC